MLESPARLDKGKWVVLTKWLTAVVLIAIYGLSMMISPLPQGEPQH